MTMSPKRFFTWVLVTSASFVVVFGVIPATVLSVFLWMFRENIPVSDKLVAVLPLEEVILDSSELLKQLYAQVADPRVRGIVLRVNSPGGAVAPSQEIYEAIKRLKANKPIVVSMGTVAASGGLYASLSATKIYAQPGTLTGSIGVILEIPNVSKISDRFGLDMITIKSGEFKDTGNMFRPMRDRDRDQLQSTVNVAYEQFLAAVVDSRHINPEKAREFADGRVILGSQAVELGLIDGTGDLIDAARQVFVELNIPLAADQRPDLFFPMEDMQFLKSILHSVTTQIPGLSLGKVTLRSQLSF